MTFDSWSPGIGCLLVTSSQLRVGTWPALTQSSAPFQDLSMPTICKYFMEDALCLGVGTTSGTVPHVPWTVLIRYTSPPGNLNAQPIRSLTSITNPRLSLLWSRAQLCPICSTLGCLYPSIANTRFPRNLDLPSLDMYYHPLPGCWTAYSDGYRAGYSFWKEGKKQSRCRSQPDKLPVRSLCLKSHRVSGSALWLQAEITGGSS